MGALRDASRRKSIGADHCAVQAVETATPEIIVAAKKANSRVIARLLV
jgi:hypothetical protein